MNYNQNYIYLENLIFTGYNWVRSCCKKQRRLEENIEKLLLHYVSIKDKNMILHYISKGANNLDECLKVACEKDYYQIAELLVEKGANPLSGIRYSKSLNIIRMLYRHRQKSDNIN
jgi:transcriptional regulator of NAD metabolism